ncbi:MAG: hypothetical protein JWM04_1835 [Verrucomicrobiales bacterium]|nr:hypothetical protein [Verrucomicrobiales bacterium]
MSNWCLVIIALAFSLTATAEDFDHSHTKWLGILKTFTTNGAVYYADLKEHPAKLKSYLADCAKVSSGDFKNWSTNQQKAFLINLYNASLVELIADRYPIGTVKQIGGFYKGPFKQDYVALFGARRTLEGVERNLVTNYLDIRIYFALCSGAKGSPDLLNEAYDASKIDSQLTQQTMRFMANEKKNLFDPSNGKAEISILLKTAKEEFAKDQSPLKPVVDYVPESFREFAKREDVIITYMDFDWSLNDVPNRLSATRESYRISANLETRNR